jgi:hypothetical protein
LFSGSAKKCPHQVRAEVTDAVDGKNSVGHGPGVENGARWLALATVSAAFDIVGGKSVGEIFAGQTEAHLLDEIGMGQVDIARLTHLFGQAIDEFGRFKGAVCGFTDAGHGY